MPQCSNVCCPIQDNTEGFAPYNLTGALRQRNIAQMKEQIKTPEKELSNKEIAYLSDTEFKQW